MARCVPALIRGGCVRLSRRVPDSCIFHLSFRIPSTTHCPPRSRPGAPLSASVNYEQVAKLPSYVKENRDPPFLAGRYGLREGLGQEGCVRVRACVPICMRGIGPAKMREKGKPAKFPRTRSPLAGNSRVSNFLFRGKCPSMDERLSPTESPKRPRSRKRR